MTLDERVTNVACINRATCGQPLPTCWADAAALGWPCWTACCMLQEAMTAPAASTLWSDSTPRPTPGKGWPPWTYAGWCTVEFNSLKPWKYFWGLKRWVIIIIKRKVCFLIISEHRERHHLVHLGKYGKALKLKLSFVLSLVEDAFLSKLETQRWRLSVLVNVLPCCDYFPF